MSIDEIIWELEPHTKAKHEILKYYLGAWFPILASIHPRMVYVDGFAGPGVYKGGEDGSPIIALNVALNHRLLSQRRNELVFLFIEMDKRRADHLRKIINNIKLPDNYQVGIECNSFETCITRILDDISGRGKKLAPSFFFIDPFGPTGFSLQLLGQISKQNRSEVLINFSYQSLNQWFLQDPSKHKNVDLLFGDDTWREALTMASNRKEEYLRLTYQNKLEKLGWKVRPFSMINKHNQTQYYLFFATKNPLGMLAMKRAMWKSAPIGDFQYSDLSNPSQPNMFEDTFQEQYAKDLADIIFSKHRGASVRKKTIIDDLAWHPMCIERHLTRALKYLENEIQPPRILDVKNRIRKGSYPEGSIIMFSE